MLKEILSAIKETGVINSAAISLKTGVSAAMVEHATGTLLSKGYLKVANSPLSEATKCGGCNGPCKNNGECCKNAYLITEKGHRYLGTYSD